MDRNTIIAFVLIALILVAINFNSKRLQQAEQAKQDSIAQVQQTAEKPVNSDNNTFENKPNEAVTANEAIDTLIKSNGTAQTVSIENDDLKVSFNTKGGAIESVELKNYKKYGGDPLFLSKEGTSQFGYKIPVRLNGATQVVNTEKYVFTVKNKTANSISFELDLNGQGSIVQEYALSESKFEVDYNLKLNNLEGEINNGSPIELHWEQATLPLEKSLDNERNKTSIYYKEKDDDATYLSETSDDSEKVKFDVEWISFKQQFFNQTLIAEQAFKGATIETVTPAVVDSSNLKSLSAKSFIAYNNQADFNFPMRWYLGPIDYSILSDKGDLQLDEMAYLGWGIFGWVNKLVIIPMFNLLNGFIGNYGIIILILTFVIKMVLMPLTFKSYQSMAKMQVLKPEIDVIKEKHKDDPMKTQQATMKLYSSAGASPFSGCLPQLLQMPILIAMYSFFPGAIDLRQESFLWAEDLSTYDSILNLPFTIPFYGDHVSLFTLLSGVSMIFMSRMNMSMSAGADNPAMKYMPYFMPIFLVVIFNSFSAALTYYFFLSNIITFGQQQIIKRFFIDEDKIRQQLSKNMSKAKKKAARAGNGKGKNNTKALENNGGCMGMMAEFQKQQEAKMREQQKQRTKSKKRR